MAAASHRNRIRNGMGPTPPMAVARGQPRCQCRQRALALLAPRDRGDALSLIAVCEGLIACDDLQAGASVARSSPRSWTSPRRSWLAPPAGPSHPFTRSPHGYPCASTPHSGGLHEPTLDLTKDADGTLYSYQELAIRVGRRHGSKNTRWNCCTKGTPSSRPMPTCATRGHPGPRPACQRA